jgi:radical SAM superfamily enzyme YgiQ (UPF0313 family)
MLLYLVNPANQLISIALNRSSYWNRFRLWKPLGLLVLAGLTPADWEIVILDENLAPVDYAAMPQPDLVGITAFTSQAPRAYEIAAGFRERGVTVVMGGIHATMCAEEAARFVDVVVTGEAEPVWPQVLQDAQAGCLRPAYDGGRATMDQIVPARHDLLPEGYAFGSVQTTRGCSLNCNFCSVTRFNGATYRQRPIAEVVEEFKSMPERRVLIVDDNLIGRKPEHIERAKELFRALAAAKTGKSWIGQTTINIADDEELLELAGAAGCIGLFIGFESVTPEGLAQLGKKSAMLSGRNITKSVDRIRRHGILVVGSFIIGLDTDHVGVGRLIADAAGRYGVDSMNVLFLTPLPGTRLWDQVSSEGRVALGDFPEDWKYYTLNYPVARYKYLNRDQVVREMNECNSTFYSVPNIARRLSQRVLAGRNPLFVVVSSLTSRRNSMLFAAKYEALWPTEPLADGLGSDGPGLDAAGFWQKVAEQSREIVATLKLQVSRLWGQS